jgi:hypothetical protein
MKKIKILYFSILAALGLITLGIFLKPSHVDLSAMTVSIKANPETITIGQGSMLTLSSRNARLCEGLATDGKKFYGNGAVYPLETTKFTLFCYESQDRHGKSVAASVTVKVLPTPMTPLYIQKADIEGSTGPEDNGNYLYVTGVGLTASSTAHIKGFDGVLYIDPKYVSTDGKDRRFIVTYPSINHLDETQYEVYVTNGTLKSNMVYTMHPSRG